MALFPPLQLQDQGLRKHKEAGTLGVKVFTEAAWCLLRDKKIWEVEYKQISLPSNIDKDISRLIANQDILNNLFRKQIQSSTPEL